MLQQCCHPHTLPNFSVGVQGGCPPCEPPTVPPWGLLVPARGQSDLNYSWLACKNAKHGQKIPFEGQEVLFLLVIFECGSVLPWGRGMLRQFGAGHSWFLNPGMSLCPQTGLAVSTHLLVNNSKTSNTQQAAAAPFAPSNLWDDVDVRFYLLLLLMHPQNLRCELPAWGATAWSWDMQQHHQEQGTGMPRSGTGRHWSTAVACVH